MPQSTSNLLSPFLSGNNAPKIGGSTTAGFAPTTGGQTLGVTSGTGVATPVPTGVNFSSIPGMVSPSTPSSTAGGTNGGLTSAQRTADQSQLTADQTQLASLLAQQNAQGNTKGTIAPGTTNVNNPNPTATYPGIVGTLASTASQPSSQYTTAQNNYQTEKGQLGALQTQAAQAQGSVQNTPGISLQAAAGQSGQIQNLLANEEAPISQEMTADQAAAQAAIAQQGTQQSGLSSAGALAAPQAANVFGTYNPQTGQYEQYGGTSGGGTGSAAVASGNYQGGTQFEQTAVPSYQAAVNDAQGLASWFNTPASQGGGQGVNPTSLNAGNALTNWASGQNFSNPQYPQLATYLNDFSSKLSSILGANSGEITNYKQQLVHSMLNGTSDPASIQTQMNTMLNVAALNMQAQAKTYGINWSPNGGTSNSNGTTGNNSGGTIFPTTIQ